MLPEDVQWYIWKIYYTNNVKPRIDHKDWWIHSVRSRTVLSKNYMDAEKFPGFADCFAYGNTVPPHKHSKHFLLLTGVYLANRIFVP